MTALSARQTIPDTRDRGRAVYDLVASTQVYAGGLVGLSSAGLALAWRNNATDVFIGIALEDALEPTQDVVPVNEDGVIVRNIPVAAAVQGSVGLEVYCTTDNLLENAVLDAGSTARAIGRITRFRSASDCDVQLYTPAEWSARYIQAVT